MPSWYNLCNTGTLKEIWQHTHLYKLIIYMKHCAWYRYWIQAKRKWLFFGLFTFTNSCLYPWTWEETSILTNPMVNSRPWLKSSKQKQRGRCLYHLSTVYSLKITLPSSATGPLNALTFHLHFPSELSVTSQDAYPIPPLLSQTLQTPSHSDSQLMILPPSYGQT